jgi:capsular polysaccharide export protein
VHVVNSLSGFEALMAGAHVVTWGRGWYAGWGLTEDRVQPARSHPASLLQLVHAAYLERPRYFDRHCRQFVTAPVAAELLAHERAQPDAAPNWTARALAWLPRGLTRAVTQVYERWSDERQHRTLR